MKGEAITTMQEIFDLADRHKSCWLEKWKRHVPAYILQQAGARQLHEWIETRQVYYYTAKGTERAQKDDQGR